MHSRQQETHEVQGGVARRPPNCCDRFFVSRRGFSYVSLICMRMKLAAPRLFSALMEADIDAVLDKKASHALRPRASIDVPCFYLNYCFVLAAAICGNGCTGVCHSPC